MCADVGDDNPGPVAVRDSDGLFSSAISRGGNMTVVTGLDNHVEHLSFSPGLYPVSTDHIACGLHNFGVSAFSKAGTLFVAGNEDYHKFAISASPNGVQFTTSEFSFTQYVTAVWITGSRTGEGALVTYWLVTNPSGSNCPTVELHVAHVTLVNGAPNLTDDTPLPNVPAPCGDFQGSGVDLNGHAYVASYDASSSGTPATGPQPCGSALPTSHPLYLYVQQSGSTV
jgi:hypothetical protein